MCELKSNSFYKIKPTREGWKGERYFKVNDFTKDQHVIQAVYCSLKESKGKQNSLGIYVIHLTSFLHNYLALGLLEEVTEEEYNKHFNKIVNLLMNGKEVLPTA